ncbi:MAG: 50S ribosomal protein L35 [Planctomycetota bacterium]
MPKNKPNKGLLKRIRITKSGKVKMRRAFGRHLRSHKSGTTMRSYRRPKYATPGDARRVAAMLHTSISSNAKQSKSASTESSED